ncbi:MAG TPA: hypothetical protein PLI99_03855 [archaeon]|mgnify:FL=1|nr:hypothetical protein [archaeon]
MGLISFLKKKALVDKNESIVEGDLLNEGDFVDNVIIPIHVREKQVKVSKKAVRNIFVVKSVYDISKEVMLFGFVDEGVLKKRMKTKINGVEFSISDLKKFNSSVKELISGFEGSIFLKGKKQCLVRVGDVLVFK